METPEHDKVAKLQPAWQNIGAFLDWLQNKSKYHICVWAGDEWSGDELAYAGKSENDLIAEFYGVDLKIYEQESRAILDQQRALNRGPLDEKRFGVTWATPTHPIFQTGYVYTYDEAIEVAKKHPMRVTDSVVDPMCGHTDHTDRQVYGRVEDEADSYEEVAVTIDASTP